MTERLNAGLERKLTLVSAPAGFGKTTLLSEWVAGCGRSVAWLSLGKGDNDPARFLAYFVAALQTVRADVGKAALVQAQNHPLGEHALNTLASIFREQVRTYGWPVI